MQNGQQYVLLHLALCCNMITCLVCCSLQGRDALYDNIPGCGVDPRGLAQRIMAVKQLLSQCCLACSNDGYKPK